MSRRDRRSGDRGELVDRLIRAPEAAQRLGISRRTLSRRIATGEIRALKRGPEQRAPVFVRESEIARYLGRMLPA